MVLSTEQLQRRQPEVDNFVNLRLRPAAGENGFLGWCRGLGWRREWVEHDIFLAIPGGAPQNPRERKAELETDRERGVLPNEIGAAAGVRRKIFCITLVHLTPNSNYYVSFLECIGVLSQWNRVCEREMLWVWLLKWFWRRREASWRVLAF